MKRQRLAISDWQIVGVAISHDKKTAASGEWRVANGRGERQFALSSHDGKWQRRATGKTAASGE
ncbi:MAG: hypothetical protein ACO2PK_03560 [Armatimonadota bacterium]